MNSSRRLRSTLYVAAVSVTLLVCLEQLVLSPSVGEQGRMLLSLSWMVLIAYCGGFMPGLVATGTCIVFLVLSFGWMEARFMTGEGATQLALITISGVMISSVCEVCRRKISSGTPEFFPLHQDGDLLQRIHTLSGIGSWDYDHANGLLAVSDEACRITGLNRNELSGNPEIFLRRVHPEDSALVKSAYLASLRDGLAGFETEHRYVVSPAGKTRVLHHRGEHLRNSTGAIVRSIGVIQDITERKLLEESLAESEGRLADQTQAFELAVSGAPIQEVLNLLVGAGQRRLGAEARTAIFIVDADGACLRVGASAGLTDVYTRAVDGLKISPENTSCGLAAFSGQAVIVRDVEQDPRWGPYLDVARREEVRACWSFPIYSTAGKVLGTFTVYHRLPREPGLHELERVKLLAKTAAVIVERHKVEEALRQSEQEFRAIFTESCVGKAEADPATGRYLRVNAAFCRLTGYSEAELLQRSIVEFAPPDNQDANATLHGHFVQAERPRWESEQRYTRPDGSVVWVHLLANLIHDLAGRPVRIIGVFQDITARKQAEAALAAAKDQAEAANHAKDRFIATLSHELRNPLNPVLLTATDMLGNPDLDDEDRDAWEMVQKNVSLEAKLIDDLLDLTRISQGKMVLNISEVDAHAVLRDALQTVKTGMEKRRIALTLDLAARHSLVEGDAMRLQQVFWNVLSNATKFTPVGGSVTVRTRDGAGETFIVEVTDSGMGITRDELARLFEVFAQGDHGGDRGSHGFGGLGLGLAISRQVMDMIGGKISAWSEGRGKGAVFTITIPLAEVSESRNRPRNAMPTKDAWPPDDVVPPKSVEAADKQKQRLCILLVEDHETTRVTLTSLLSRRGYQVLPAGTVAEARAFARHGNFDLVVSDIGLPDGDGHSLMAELRDAFAPSLRGIAMSGYGMPDDIARSHEAGFSVHLTKPVEIAALEAALGRIVAKGAM